MVHVKDNYIDQLLAEKLGKSTPPDRSHQILQRPENLPVAAAASAQYHSAQYRVQVYSTAACVLLGLLTLFLWYISPELQEYEAQMLIRVRQADNAILSSASSRRLGHVRDGDEYWTIRSWPSLGRLK